MKTKQIAFWKSENRKGTFSLAIGVVSALLALTVQGCNLSSQPKFKGAEPVLQPSPEAAPQIVTSPVPGDTVIMPPPPAPLPKPTTPPVVQEQPYGFLYTGVMDFTVGEFKDYMMDVWVPSPGVPLIKFKNLPEGSFLSLVDRKFIWAPELGSSFDPTNPSSGVKLFTVTVEISSSADPTTFLTRDFLLISRSPKTPLQIQTKGVVWEVTEGVASTKAITLFEQGGTKPLSLSVQNAPTDLVLVQGANDQNYTLEYRGGNTLPANAGSKECVVQGANTLCTTAYPVVLVAKSDSGAEAKLSVVIKLKTKN